MSCVKKSPRRLSYARLAAGCYSIGTRAKQEGAPVSDGEATALRRPIPDARVSWRGYFLFSRLYGVDGVGLAAMPKTFFS